MPELTWLDEWSIPAMREALADVAPELALQTIELAPVFDAGNPRWATGTAVVDGAHVAKFALSSQTAQRVWNEGDAIGSLSGQVMALPRVTAISRHPALFVSDLVIGVPLSYELVGAALPARIDKLGRELGRFLATLHDERTYALIADLGRTGGVVPPPAVPVQATTDELRAGLPPLLRADQVALAKRWCDWVDAVLEDAGEPVFVHGDLHGYNQIWDPRQLRLRLVADFEASGAAEPEYDFRYVPALGPGVALFRSTLEHYERLTRRRLDVARVLAWHVRTVLGDALWRSQAGVELPGGGTPSTWADELALRFRMLAVTP